MRVSMDKNEEDVKYEGIDRANQPTTNQQGVRLVRQKFERKVKHSKKLSTVK